MNGIGHFDEGGLPRPDDTLGRLLRGQYVVPGAVAVRQERERLFIERIAALTNVPNADAGRTLAQLIEQARRLAA